MSDYQVVKDGVITNIIVGDEQFYLDNKDSWDGGVLVPHDGSTWQSPLIATTSIDQSDLALILSLEG